MEELLRSENSERKCFFANHLEIGQSEVLTDVVERINNKKAVDCIIAYLEKAKKYCESNGITFDDMIITLNFDLYYEGESSEYTSDEIQIMDPIKDFYGVRIGLAAYSNAETRALRYGRRNFDLTESQGFVFIDDETEEFGLGELCTSFVITYDGFKEELSKRGYKIDEEITNFGGFNALKDRKSLRVKLEQKKSKKRNNEGRNIMEKEILRIEEENRRFANLQRERAINSAQRARLISTMLTGACIVGAIASTILNGVDVNQAIEQEFNMFSSWEAVEQYFQTIGPLTTLASVGTGIFVSSAILDSIRLRRLREEQADFESSIDANNMGSNTNVRTRNFSING